MNIDLKGNQKLLGTILVFLAIILAIVFIIALWPKAFSYSECGKGEPLGAYAGISRIKEVSFTKDNILVEAVVITACYQKISLESEYSDGQIKISVMPSGGFGSYFSDNCVCDRELKLRLPNYPYARTIEFYLDGKLVDKRTIADGKITDGIEFCESDANYKPLCYYRLAFEREDFELCKKAHDQKECTKKLEEFLTLKCVKSKNPEECRMLLAESLNQNK